MFLRKRAPGRSRTTPTRTGSGHARSSIEGATVPVNRYFLQPPGDGAGDWSRKDTLYGDGFSVQSDRRPGQPVEGGGRAVAESRSLPERQWPNSATGRSDPRSQNRDDHRPPSPRRRRSATSPKASFFVGDDKVIRQVENGKAEPVTYCGIAAQGQRHAARAARSAR